VKEIGWINPQGEFLPLREPHIDWLGDNIDFVRKVIGVGLENECYKQGDVLMLAMIKSGWIRVFAAYNGGFGFGVHSEEQFAAVEDHIKGSPPGGKVWVNMPNRLEDIFTTVGEIEKCGLRFLLEEGKNSQPFEHRFEWREDGLASAGNTRDL
jgi:hypothetical protein